MRRCPVPVPLSHRAPKSPCRQIHRLSCLPANFLPCTNASPKLAVIGQNSVRRFFVNQRRVNPPARHPNASKYRAPDCPVPRESQKHPAAWISALEKFLPLPLRHSPGNAKETSIDDANTAEGDRHVESKALAVLLSQARAFANLDLLAHLGFQLDRWPAVHVLLSKLLDSADDLRKKGPPRRPLSDLDWGSSSGVSLDQLSESWATRVAVKSDAVSPLDPGLNLDTISRWPTGDDMSRIYMGQVWQSLGYIILRASQLPANESKIAMSYVFQILARLHESDSILHNVYKYVSPDTNQVMFRPPDMHLLMRHIMTVLSDAAWSVHEAKVAAEAAAAGKESPYFPFKMDIRDLGLEIWMEFVLWCCVEHGYAKEGAWLLERLKDEKGEFAWKFQSWAALLQYPDVVKKTNIDAEEVWRRPDSEVDSSSKRHQAFHGLGRRTISTEVVSALMDGLVNQFHIGPGDQKLSPAKTLSNFLSRLGLGNGSAVDQTLQGTNRTSNWLTSRVTESAVIRLETDPQLFELFLKSHSNHVPPWDDRTCVLVEELCQLTKPRLFDETSAFIGLMEYLIRSYAARHCSSLAFKAFFRLQEIVNASKRTQTDSLAGNIGQQNRCTSINSDVRRVSSISQLSNVTYAQILDLATTSQEFILGEKFLCSNDLDYSPISADSYGDQALAPSILRFASATKNTTLYDKVSESLRQPLSWNTLKAILNYKITVGEWDQVADMFIYLRDRKLKSWGHSNVTVLAATLLRIEARIQLSEGQQSAVEIKKCSISLNKAKDIFLRLLNGEFNSAVQSPSTKYYPRALTALHRIFISSPGIVRPVASAAALRYQTRASQETVPLIPAVAFNYFLGAVVEIYGSVAGYQLWKRFCLDPALLAARGVQLSDMMRYENNDDPAFYMPGTLGKLTPELLVQLCGKLVIPNLDTLRIISRAAVDEYTLLQRKEPLNGDGPGDSVLPGLPLPAEPSSGPSLLKRQSVTALDKVLDFCVVRFVDFDLSYDEIRNEIGNLLTHSRRRRTWRTPESRNTR